MKKPRKNDKLYWHLLICYLQCGRFNKNEKNGIHAIQDWTATMRHGVTKKERSTKRLKYTGNLLGNLQIKVVLILDLQTMRSKVKLKHSIGIKFQNLAVQGNKLLTWKIMQSIRITSRPPSRINKLN